MEILAKCWCEKCQKPVYPRPNVRFMELSVDKAYWAFVIRLDCPYCDTAVGYANGTVSGTGDIADKPEVKD